MKFLIDNAVSPHFAEALRAAGHDAIHVRDRGLAEADDDDVIDLAVKEDRAIVTADTDFGGLLVVRNAAKPSIIMFRHGAPRRPADQASVLLANLPSIADDLMRGAIAVFHRERIRVRRLS